MAALRLELENTLDTETAARATIKYTTEGRNTSSAFSSNLLIVYRLITGARAMRNGYSGMCRNDFLMVIGSKVLLRLQNKLGV
jgi:hypothetical protein